MSTRSTTHFTHSDESKPTAIIYRHSDGYPKGAGTDILRFLDECEKLKDSRFGDPSYLAAKYVVFLAEMFNNTYEFKGKEHTLVPCKSRLDFISVGVLDSDPGDIEYRYVIDCSHSPRPKVTCYELHDTSTPNWRKWAKKSVAIPEPQPETAA